MSTHAGSEEGATEKKITARAIHAMKGQRRIVSLTAYDFWMARLLDEAGVPLLLVGDSLGMVMLGYDNTLPVTMDEMLHHTKAVSRAVKKSLVVADMPFLSYQVSVEQAVIQAGRFIKEGGADAVKVEGGMDMVPQVGAMVKAGIPVLGHLGLTPQSILTLGGYRVQGRDAKTARQMVEDAKALERAGVFGLVLECVPSALAKKVTRTVGMPTIGIGAGQECDGQILVTHDVLGLTTWFQQPKFTKRYADLPRIIREAVRQYADEVERRHFPGPEQSYE